MTTRALVRIGAGPIHIGSLSSSGRTWATDAGYLPVDRATAITGTSVEIEAFVDEHEHELCPSCREWGERLATTMRPHEVIPAVYRRRIQGWPTR